MHRIPGSRGRILLGTQLSQWKGVRGADPVSCQVFETRSTYRFASPTLDCISELLEKVFPLLPRFALEERRDSSGPRGAAHRRSLPRASSSSANSSSLRAVVPRFPDEAVQFARVGQLLSNAFHTELFLVPRCPRLPVESLDLLTREANQRVSVLERVVDERELMVLLRRWRATATSGQGRLP